MKKRGILRTAAFAALASLAVAITPGTAGAAAISLPVSGGVKQLTIVDSTGPLWRTPLANAAKDWDKAPELSITVVRGAMDTASGTCAATPGTIRICTADYKPNVRSGFDVHQNTDASGHVVSVSVRIDGSVMASIWGLDQTFLEIYGGRRVVSCDVIGESLGVPQNLVPNSCMNPLGTMLNDPASSLHPAPADYRAITRLYG